MNDRIGNDVNAAFTIEKRKNMQLFCSLLVNNAKGYVAYGKCEVLGLEYIKIMFVHVKLQNMLRNN